MPYGTVAGNSAGWSNCDPSKEALRPQASSARVSPPTQARSPDRWPASLFGLQKQTLDERERISTNRHPSFKFLLSKSLDAQQALVHIRICNAHPTSQLLCGIFTNAIDVRQVTQAPSSILIASFQHELPSVSAEELGSLVALATALSVAATPGLTLKVEGASSVTDVDNFKVSAILTNTGDETLKILNDPSGPLSNLPTDSFSIVNSQGSSARFAGAKAKYVPAVAAEVGDYTTLAPGQSVTVDHDLSEAYNLTATGAGTYEVEPRNVFYLVNEKNEISSIHARVPKVHKARVSGRLSKVRPTPTLAKRATYVSCPLPAKPS
ncbi:hypothetical protein DFP72DRAFT_856493 [Ephemerocybe angulata]|uniref:Uncharacterized protein n=1 Tax=Ephemerocybe angulata TaxID=980116 RepID=A0A8H6LWJ9_9AGAR|nr:hypothetical protein DFP72DRAFT_856493 [Tulosesus angulatus]